MTPQTVWESWVREHGAKLLLYAKRWSHDQAEAEDWVQESFTRFWKNRSRVEDPAAYLYQSVRTIAIDASRKRQSESRRDESLRLQSSQHEQFQSDMELFEWRLAVSAAIRALPIEQQEIVTLKIWSELTFAQISEIVSVPLGTVTSRYRYALKSLKTQLSEDRIDD